MATLRILIVEDEIVIARDIEEQLKGFGYNVVGIAKNSEVAITAFDEMKPDLVLMDIVLKKSAFDGVEVAQVFNSLKRVPIIYLTSFDNPRVYERAKATEPANYLIKPCNEKQLKVAIGLAIHNFSYQQEAILKENPGPSESQKLFPGKDCIFIREKELFIKIDIDDLLWVKAANAYVEIHTSTDKFIITTNLKSFLNQVSYPTLWRIHRSYAANLLKVHAFDGGNVYIKKGKKDHRIPVAPKNREEIFSHFPKLKTRPK